MDSSKLREDIVSPLLKVSTYKGFTLSGPREAIIRKVYSTQTQRAGSGTQANAGADASFTQLNFRLQGTSPACMLNARVRLVVPLRFFAAGSVRDDNDGNANTAQAWDNMAIGPRRNGLLKSFSTISTIINNTTSFSVRPDESLTAAEIAFPQCLSLIHISEPTRPY